MSAVRAFVEDILENPDDSVTRLVFADWLSDQDDPRGDLLRLQTNLSLGTPDPTYRAKLHKQQNRLLRSFGSHWCRIPKPLCIDYTFDRGFTNVTLNIKRMIGQTAHDVETWFAKSWVHWVRFDRPGRYLQALMRQPWIRHISALDLSRHALMDEVIYRLTTTPGALAGLRHLNLSNNRLTDAGAQHLARSPVLSSLRSLDLRNNRLTDTGVRAILESPFSDKLQRLEMHGNNLSEAAIDHFLRWREGRSAVGTPYPCFINSVGMEFVFVPPGSFLMGSPNSENQRKNHEGPRVPVRITKPFYLGRYHVTQREYERIIGANPSHFSSMGTESTRVTGLSTHNFPVDMVSPEDAETFCERLSQLDEEKQEGRVYRLATEAEWEYACRAGEPEDWPFAFGPTLGAHQANFDHSRPFGRARRGEPVHRPMPVGSFPPNAWGLFDMHGNAWDWVADFYDNYPSTEEFIDDPTGPETGTHGILRGGSWYNAAHYCRSASRFRTTRTEGSFCISFRVAFDA